MAKNYRIGIVGVGAIAGMHARAIADLPNAKLTACCHGSPEKAKRFTDEFGGQWFETIELMLDADLCDVVTVCTPSGATYGAHGRCTRSWSPCALREAIGSRSAACSTDGRRRAGF